MSNIKFNQKSNRFFGYSLLILLNTLILSFNFRNNWPLIQKTGLHAPGYADMKSVLLAAGCSRNGYFPWENLAGDCVAYWYGNVILILSQIIHFSTSWTEPISEFLIVIALLGLISILSSLNSHIKYFLFATLIIWSPPVHLLFERGNLDIAMFLLVLAAAYFASKKLFFSSMLVLTVATLMKFYTLPLMWIVAYLSRRSQYFVAYFLITLLVTFDVVIEYARLTNFNMAISYDGIAQFGASELELYFDLIGIELPEVFWLVFVNLFTIAAAFLLVILRSRGRFKELVVKKNELSYRSAVAIFSVAIFLFCFISGKNYDYRLIFLVSFILTVDEIIVLPNKYLIAWKGFGIAMLWFTFFMYSFTNIIPGYLIVLFQLIGDVLIVVFASIVVALILETIISWYSKNKKNKLRAFKFLNLYN